MARTYKLRAIPNGSRGSDGARYQNYSFTVPPDIAHKVPDGMEFECHMDEDGIHYRPVKQSAELPSWAIGETPDAKKPKRRRQRPAPLPVEA